MAFEPLEAQAALAVKKMQSDLKEIMGKSNQLHIKVLRDEQANIACKAISALAVLLYKFAKASKELPSSSPHYIVEYCFRSHPELLRYTKFYDEDDDDSAPSTPPHNPSQPAPVSNATATTASSTQSPPAAAAASSTQTLSQTWGMPSSPPTSPELSQQESLSQPVPGSPSNLPISKQALHSFFESYRQIPTPDDVLDCEPIDLTLTMSEEATRIGASFNKDFYTVMKELLITGPCKYDIALFAKEEVKDWETFVQWTITEETTACHRRGHGPRRRW